MIAEEFVTFETAKLLKAAGFPQDIKQTMFYNAQGTTWHMGDRHWINGYAKPTQAMAMRWLREEHEISVEPRVTLGKQWMCEAWEFDTIANCVNEEMRFPTYEAAAEAGIQAACKVLIENEN